jgi:prevent-host-death family protein
MTTVSMVEFRRDTEAIIRKVRRGQRMVLTYRGKPVMRLEPIADEEPSDDDPFYALPSHAVDNGGSLTNEEIDQIVYGQ